eukprot:s398_g3.t1
MRPTIDFLQELKETTVGEAQRILDDAQAKIDAIFGAQVPGKWQDLRKTETRLIKEAPQDTLGGFRAEERKQKRQRKQQLDEAKKLSDKLAKMVKKSTPDKGSKPTWSLVSSSEAAADEVREWCKAVHVKKADFDKCDAEAAAIGATLTPWLQEAAEAVNDFEAKKLSQKLAKLLEKSTPEKGSKTTWSLVPFNEDAAHELREWCKAFNDKKVECQTYGPFARPDQAILEPWLAQAQEAFKGFQEHQGRLVELRQRLGQLNIPDGVIAILKQGHRLHRLRELAERPQLLDGSSTDDTPQVHGLGKGCPRSLITSAKKHRREYTLNSLEEEGVDSRMVQLFVVQCVRPHFPTSLSDGGTLAAALSSCFSEAAAKSRQPEPDVLIHPPVPVPGDDFPMVPGGMLVEIENPEDVEAAKSLSEMDLLRHGLIREADKYRCVFCLSGVENDPWAIVRHLSKSRSQPGRAHQKHRKSWEDFARWLKQDGWKCKERGVKLLGRNWSCLCGKQGDVVSAWLPDHFDENKHKEWEKTAKRNSKAVNQRLEETWTKAFEATARKHVNRLLLNATPVGTAKRRQDSEAPKGETPAAGAQAEKSSG